MAPVHDVVRLILQPMRRFMQLQSVVRTRQCVNVAFTRHLLLTNISLSMVLSGGGDFIQQKYQMGRGLKVQQQFNLSRTTQMTITGGTVGLLCHQWYQTLDRVLPGRSIKTIIKKLAVDQLIFSPVCISVFFLTWALTRHTMDAYTNYYHSKQFSVNISQSLSDSNTSTSSTKTQSPFKAFMEEFRHKGVLLYLSEWLVWPPAQLINFYFLPTQYRVLYDNSVSLLFDVYTSHVCYNVQVEDIKAMATSADQLLTRSKIDNSQSSSNGDNDLMRNVENIYQCSEVPKPVRLNNNTDRNDYNYHNLLQIAAGNR
uniref:Mpv17-like protein 2 n=1 Tax=Hirondellea gigas TaxID=1518452 RepID=A0A2P2HWU6_9CRUS